MKTLIAPTEDFIKREKTTLTADVSAGSNVTLTVENNSGIAEDTFIVIGREGSEVAELQQVNQAVSAGTSIRVATLLFNHKAGEEITVYRYNQRKFYGSATAGGSYVELASDGSPSVIQVDDPQGTVLEYTGSTYAYFKATYYNSTTAEETDTDEATETLADETGRYTSLYHIRVEAGLTKNPYISDERIERKRKQAENEINSTLITRYSLPLAEVPPLIQHICELLAAGYIAWEEFGEDGPGGKKLGEARAILKAIQKGGQRLIGEDGGELEVTSKSNTLRGFPSNDGESDADTPERSFSVNQKF